MIYLCSNITFLNIDCRTYFYFRFRFDYKSDFSNDWRQKTGVSTVITIMQISQIRVCQLSILLRKHPIFKGNAISSTFTYIRAKCGYNSIQVISTFTLIPTLLDPLEIFLSSYYVCIRLALHYLNFRRKYLRLQRLFSRSKQMPLYR